MTKFEIVESTPVTPTEVPTVVRLRLEQMRNGGVSLDVVGPHGTAANHILEVHPDKGVYLCRYVSRAVAGLPTDPTNLERVMVLTRRP